MKKDLQLAATIKDILDLIKKISLEKSLDLGIPPYGAIKYVAGSNHRKGARPNSV